MKPRHAAPKKIQSTTYIAQMHFSKIKYIVCLVLKDICITRIQKYSITWLKVDTGTCLPGFKSLTYNQVRYYIYKNSEGTHLIGVKGELHIITWSSTWPYQGPEGLPVIITIILII